jgi:hypothetical protein
MKSIGTKVSWVDGNGVSGSGMIINSAYTKDDVSHYLVAVDAAPNMPHQVIYCADTWLKELP